MDKIRLQKYFTDCGVMSRRAAEAEIAEGRVTVNGVVAETGQKIDPDADVVMYNNKRVLPTSSKHTYIMLHKPRGYITSMSDERGRACVTELLDGLSARVYPVGRLDYNSEGLLLLTDDGELANKLTHPKNEIPKYYLVSVDGAVSDAALEALRAPHEDAGQILRAKSVEIADLGDRRTLLEFTLTEGKNREIRRICNAAGLTVRRLCRVGVGKISLGELPVSKYRFLVQQEIDYLLGL